MDFESLMVSHGARRRIVGQDPVGSDLGGQRESLGFSSVQQPCMEPPLRFLEMSCIEGNGLNPGGLLVSPPGVQTIQLCIHSRGDMEGADCPKDLEMVSLAEVEDGACVADHDLQRSASLRPRAQRMSSN